MAARMDIRSLPGFFPDFALPGHKTSMGVLSDLLRASASKAPSAAANAQIRNAQRPDTQQQRKAPAISGARPKPAESAYDGDAPQLLLALARGRS